MVRSGKLLLVVLSLSIYAPHAFASVLDEAIGSDPFDWLVAAILFAVLLRHIGTDYREALKAVRSFFRNGKRFPRSLAAIAIALLLLVLLTEKAMAPTFGSVDPARIVDQEMPEMEAAAP